jgi:hypothetical protein
MMLRNMLWWDGKQPKSATVEDSTLPKGGTARLVAARPKGAPVILAIKAGHNGENHNQNDVGSFMVHVDGENLLTDPGRGLYSRDYFGKRRYENIFANSYGHSVPRIAGQLQAAGADYRGTLVDVQLDAENDAQKEATVEFARAYPVSELASAQRQLSVAAGAKEAVVAWLHDRFRFESQPQEIEEAFVTWMEVETEGSDALIRGQQHTLRLTIEEPAGAHFHLEQLDEASKANHREGVLKRLTFRLPVATETEARVRLEIS